MKLTQADYQYLQAVMQAAQYNGMQSAAQAVALYHKLALLEAQEANGDSHSTSTNQPSANESSGD